jgi:hypothetical protein
LLFLFNGLFYLPFVSLLCLELTVLFSKVEKIMRKIFYAPGSIATGFTSKVFPYSNLADFVVVGGKLVKIASFHQH